MAAHFGNVPETNVAPVWSYQGNWLTSAQAVGSTGFVTPPPGALLPGQTITGFDGGVYGGVVVLDQNASLDPPAAGIPTNINYMDLAQPLYAKVFFTTAPGSATQINWTTQATTGGTDYYAPTTGSGSFALPLNSSTFGVQSATIGPIVPGPAGTHPQLLINTATHDPLDILGMQYYTPGKPQGMVVDTFSAGGYSATGLLSNNASAGPVLAAMGPWDAIMITLGANDGGYSTPDQFKSNLESMIAALRGPDWLDNPDLKIILAGDPDARGNNSTWYDQYVGAEMAIAQNDPNVMVINLRRMTDDQGWRDGDPQNVYTIDGIHYSAYGAQLVASLETAAILGQPVPEPASLATVTLGAAILTLRPRRRAR